MEKIWGSINIPQSTKIQNVELNQQNNLLLPNQIGCRIIQLQMEIMETQNLTKELIINLLEHYSKAVEFFEERGSPKYLLYQKKMQNFFSKPAINQIMNGKTGKMLIKKQKKQEQLKKAKTQSQFFAKKLLQNSKQSEQKQQGIIKKQLKNQQKNLEQRIQRKRAISNKSTKQKTEPITSEQTQKYDNIEVTEFLLDQQLSSSNKKNSKVFI